MVTKLQRTLPAGRGAPVRTVWDNFCWGITPWDTKKVEAELKKRGLNPIADHDGKDFFSFHVKDPDGFDLQISNANKTNRRTTPATGKLNTPAAVRIHWLAERFSRSHLISRSPATKRPSRSIRLFSAGNLPVTKEARTTRSIAPDRRTNPDPRRQCECARRVDAGNGGPPVRRAQMDHIAFDIAKFDPDKVKAELLKRGLTAQEDTGATTDSPPAEHDIHTSTHKSYHTTTPNGYNCRSVTGRESRKPQSRGAATFL